MTAAVNSGRADTIAAHLPRLIAIGVALSSERNRDRLTEHILEEAQSLTRAEGGTLYLVTSDRRSLAFSILRNNVLKTALGGSSGQPIPFPPLPLYAEDGGDNVANVATACMHLGHTI